VDCGCFRLFFGQYAKPIGGSRMATLSDVNAGDSKRA
jgi:hypothetical protein